jgi:hypothetical protein
VRRGNTMGGLLLEGVQHVDGRGELRGVDGAIGIGVVPIPELHDAGAAETLERFRGGVCFTTLCRVQRVTHFGSDLFREVLQIRSRRTQPDDGPTNHTSIRI